MAIFEKAIQNKAIIDDTETLLCTVENSQNINNHTEYILRVERGASKESRWHVSRRYRDFAALHCSLQQANIELPLPPKKLIGNMQPGFIAQRQVALQAYLNEVLKHQILSLTLPLRTFLDPSNYSLSLAEQALQTVSIALRGDGHYDLKGPLPDIGWRIRKHYFLVTDTTSRTNCLLSWQNYGPDRYLSDKDLQAAFKSLQNLSHPYIDQILGIHNLETGAYVVRRIHENGSIRDHIYGTEYNKNYLLKYGNPKVRKTMTTGQIAHYGHQILEALKFLHDKGLMHGHIHCGNIAIENQRAVLLEVENAFVGVSPPHRDRLLQLRRPLAAAAVDVHCFGRALYEMAFGAPLLEPYCDAVPEAVDFDLESVLSLCLSSASCKQGLPSAATLLTHPFFHQPLALSRGLLQDARPHLKFPAPLKDELRKMIETIEERLRRDQKMVRSAKREVRIQEILSSEEEMRKQKRRAKKRNSLWKSSSSLGEAARSQSVSTASSPTPPHLPTDASLPPISNANSTSGSSPEGEGRSALLSAICSFDKARLARVN